MRATDAAGNVGAPVTHTWTLDTTAPNTTLTATEPSPTNDATGDFEFVADEPGVTFQCRVDASAYTPCSSPHATAALTDGFHTFNVRAIDAAGNTDPSADATGWTVDLTAPSAPTITNEPDAVTNDPDANFGFRSMDSSATFECSFDGAGYGAVHEPGPARRPEDGEHSYAVRATDTAGNTGRGDARLDGRHVRAGHPGHRQPGGRRGRVR